jgi:hypothetical protein
MAPSLIVNSAQTTPALTVTLEKATPSIPSDGYPHPAFYLSIKDSTGKIQLASKNINVTLSCSDERILQIQKFIILHVGEYYKIINATSNVIEKKSVEVTASASGYLSSKINPQIEPPSGTPFSLKVTILPSIVSPLSQQIVNAVISVVDIYGNPTKSHENLVVTLSSSNLRVADVNSKQAIIHAGNMSVLTKILTMGVEGASSITATAPNLKSSSSTINVLGPKAQKIYLWSPSTQIRNDTNTVFIAVLDNNNKPVRLSTSMNIKFSSSNSSRFSIPAQLSIPAGEWKATTTIKCNAIGSATIYASSSNLTSTSILLAGKLPGGAPIGQKLYAPINSILVDDFGNIPLILQLVDKQGIPTRTETLRTFNFFSENTAIVETTKSVNIPQGESTATIYAKAKMPGDVKITALSQDLAASEIKINAYVPLPTSTLILTSGIPVEEEIEACLITMNSGIPTALIETTIFTVSSSNTGIATADETVTIEQKSYFKYFKIKGRSPGVFTLTVTGSGLTSQNIELKVTEVKPSTFSVMAFTPLTGFSFPIIIQSISSTSSPAVNYEPITLNTLSSNPNDVSMPESAIIKLGKTETIVYGRGITTITSSITTSSTGYKSVIVKITPLECKISINIIAKNSYFIGETAIIKAQVLIENTPVEGVIVNWSGTGLEKNNSITDKEGYAENILKIRNKTNLIKAFTQIGDSIQIQAEKNISGTMAAYYLEITTNTPFTIDGSGTYLAGTQVKIDAPPSANMNGFLGVLGGKYVFMRWEGDLNSTKSSELISITGSKEVISVKAVYREDYLYPLVIVSILIVIIIAMIIYYKKFGKRNILFEQMKRLQKGSG